MQLISVILLFALFTDFTTNTSADPEPSGLKSITDDLRILSRVSNAIGIHFYLIQKDSKFENILAELFHIPASNFSKFLNIKSDETIEEINRINEAFQAFKGEITDPKMVEKYPEMMSESMNTMNFFSSLIRENLDVKSENALREAASSLYKDNVFNYCDGINFDVVTKFLHYFEFRPVDYKTPTDNEIEKNLKEFENQKPIIIKCVNDIEQLSTDVDNLDIFKIGEDYKKIRKSIELATGFSVLSKINMSEVLHGTSRLLGMSENIWSNYNDGSEEFKKSQQIVNNMIDLTILLRAYNGIETFDFTSGFKSGQDWLKALEDLTSPWFQKQLVRGADIKNLSDTLESYRNVSTVVAEIVSIWIPLADRIDNEAYMGVMNLIEIGRSAGDIGDYKKFLEGFETKIASCMAKRNTDFDFALFEKWERENQPAENILNQAVSLKSNLKEFLSLLTVIDQYGKSNLEKWIKWIENQKSIHATNESATEVVNTILAEIKWVSPLNFKKAFQIMQFVATIKKEMYGLKTMSQNHPKSTSGTTVEKILEELKIRDVVECTKAINDDLKTAGKYFGIMKNIFEFPQDVIKELISFLEEFKKVQIGIEDGFQMLKDSLPYRRNLRAIPFMNNSQSLSENFGRSLSTLETLETVHDNKDKFLHPNDFTEEAKSTLIDGGLWDWIRPNLEMRNLLNDVDGLYPVAEKLKDKSLMEMTGVFEAASKIKGLEGGKDLLALVAKALERKRSSETDYFKFVSTYDLDFSKHSGRLANTRITTNYLKMYFDELFGFLDKKEKTRTIEVLSLGALAGIGIGTVVTVILVILTLYGLTKKGRAHYRMIWIYYFGKAEDYEKRWRYSMFLDRLDGMNSLLDAAREGNTPNLIRALKSGAYIDAYNKIGNTALHIAIKLALPDQVKLLIKYGADRSLPNYKNLLPIQMIPSNYATAYPEKAKRYEKVKAIYKKYEKKTYRVSVPRVFPSSSFHIYPDQNTDVTLANRFLEAFQSITSEEAIPTTTHVVYQTDENGVLHTDSIDALSWIFHGAIIVKEKWMTDCLKDEKLINNDADYLIEKVEYKGVVYDTVKEWTTAMAKATMPYLLGTYVAVVAKDYKNLITLSTIITNQGGVMLNIFPYKEHFTKTSRPYLHATRGPLFLIIDGTEDIAPYRDDKDNMYTVFTEEQFLAFMLKREIIVDTRFNPPPVLIGDE